MKKVKIICWSVLAVVLTGVLIFGIINKGENLMNISFSFLNFGLNETNAKEISVTEIPIEDFHSIDLNWNNTYVKISKYDGDTIQLTERTEKKLNDDEKLKYTIENNQLTIDDNSKMSYGFLYMMKTPKILEMKIPNTKDFERIDVNTSSADIYINDLKSNKFTINTSSGYVSTENTTFNNCNIRSTSGDISINSSTVDNFCDINSTSGEIKCNNLKTEKLETKTTSGDITFKNAQQNDCYIKSISGEISFNGDSKTVSFNSTSGDIEADGSFSDISVKTVSGESNIKSLQFPKTFNAESTSGDIDLYIPDDEKTGFNASVSTTSGDFSSNTPLKSSDNYKIYGNGKNKFSFKTISGDINITVE